MTATSLSLLERVRSDPAAPEWRRLVELYSPLIQSFVRRQQVLGPDADDLVQEVLAVVVRRLPAFEHNERVGAFRNWLRQIAVNCLREHWREQKKQAGTSQGERQAILERLEDPDSDLTYAWNLEHDLHVTRKLLEMLRPSFEPVTWQAFQRVALDGVSAAQVAAELKLSLNAVFIAKSRVLSRLRQEAAGLLD